MRIGANLENGLSFSGLFCENVFMPDLSISLSDRDLQYLIDSLEEMLQQVDRSEQETVTDLIKRVRLGAGLPPDVLLDRTDD